MFDVTIIGSGPGGYVAAIRCAQLGLKTALIEKNPTLGGTCLNVGCIPSKALLDSSEHFFKANHEFKEHGIITGNIKIDFAQMIARKDEVVKMTCDGVSFLMKKNKVEVFTGVGSFLTPNKIIVTDSENSTKEIETKNVIIATGSKPVELPFIPMDYSRTITSTEALSLKEIPKHLLIVGAGIIGVELGSVYKRLGSKVTVIEYLDHIMPGMDVDVSKEMLRVLKKQGIDFMLSHKVKGASVKKKEVEITAENNHGEEVKFSGDYCLVAVGRRANTDSLGLEKIGLQTDERGRVIVDENLRTAIPNVYAIGDVIKGIMLAHKAEEEGVFVAETLAGQKPHINYNLIPGVAYTWPEAAGVGATEQDLKSKDIKYKSGKFPFKASGRARASMDTDGFIKILADAHTDEILGVHMVGPRIADLIIEGVVAMEYRASAEDISRMSHPHPTFTEAFKEACLDATDKRALHI